MLWYSQKASVSWISNLLCVILHRLEISFVSLKLLLIIINYLEIIISKIEILEIIYILYIEYICSLYIYSISKTEIISSKSDFGGKLAV